MRWCRTFCAIYKLLSTQCPKYLFDIIPSNECFYDTRKKQRPFFNCRTDCFKYFFFPNSVCKWSQLAPEIQNSKSIAVFKNKLLSFIRPSKIFILNVNRPESLKYLYFLVSFLVISLWNIFNLFFVLSNIGYRIYTLASV